MNSLYRELSQMAGRPTGGTAAPVLALHAPPSAQLLGTVHARRGRWNPFLPENDMQRDGGTFVARVDLRATGGRHGDGIYAFRFVADHQLNRTFKADHGRLDESGKPRLVSGHAADQAHNIMIRVPYDGRYTIRFDPASASFDVAPRPAYLTTIHSMQLNGFVWDDEDMFQKFDERRSSHTMHAAAEPDWWELALPLRTNGGIPLRADGVYQFLFSANGNEDWGFSGINDGSCTLVGGTGFGSSGGSSRHSGLTLRVNADGNYLFRVNPKTWEYEVKPMGGAAAPTHLNDLTGVQLLGSIWPEAQFDPTDSRRQMVADGNGCWRIRVTLDPGVYTANFSLSNELFLDTMALGCWLIEPTGDARLRGRAWHGKPSEPNLTLEVVRGGSFEFVYDTTDDNFYIVADGGGLIGPRPTIDSLQLVGDFAQPLDTWNPGSPANDCKRIGNSMFAKDVFLDAGRTYAYKYNANQWPWLWVFADYELDGYGRDLSGRNPSAGHSRLEDLIRYGQLTTHGNPPPLHYVCRQSGMHRFLVDLETGAYSITPCEQPLSRHPQSTYRRIDTPMTNAQPKEFIDLVKSNHVSAIEQHLSAGFNPNFKDRAGRTPLMYAAARGNDYVVRLLLDAGADVNVLDDRMGSSPLHYCSMGGSTECGRLLIRHGAHINVQNPSQGHTPLIDAVIYKNVEMTAVLLDSGANIAVKNNWGFGAVDFLDMLLKQEGTEKDRINAIKRLWDTRVAAIEAQKNSMQLFQAVLDGDSTRVHERIDAGDNLDAAWPVEQSGNDGHSALVAAARDGHGEIVAALLAAGANPYATDSLYKALALHKSAYMGHPETARPLVQAGVDLDVQGPWQGYTPLHDALWQGHPEVAEILIDGGADIMLEAVTGQRPIDIAIATYGANHPIVHRLNSRTRTGFRELNAA